MLFVSRPHRLLCDDSPLTETQRAIHPLSEQNVTFVAFQTFKNHRLVKGSRLWLRSPLVCSLVIILSWLCKGLAGLAIGFSVASCKWGLELHPVVHSEKDLIFWDCSLSSEFVSFPGLFYCVWLNLKTNNTRLHITAWWSSMRWIHYWYSVVLIIKVSSRPLSHTTVHTRAWKYPVTMHIQNITVRQDLVCNGCYIVFPIVASL